MFRVQFILTELYAGDSHKQNQWWGIINVYVAWITVKLLPKSREMNAVFSHHILWFIIETAVISYCIPNIINQVLMVITFSYFIPSDSTISTPVEGHTLFFFNVAWFIEFAADKTSLEFKNTRNFTLLILSFVNLSGLLLELTFHISSM